MVHAVQVRTISNELLCPGGVLITLRSAVDPDLTSAANRLGVRVVVFVERRSGPPAGGSRRTLGR
jgi:hypothetical protein